MNFLNYFFQAGIIVKCVMLLLLSASVVSWGLIFQRAKFFKLKTAQYKTFTRRFWGTGDLNKLYADVDNNIEDRHGLASIFHSGFKLFLRMRQPDHFQLEAIKRVMMIQYEKEATGLENFLSIFSSVGAIAPFVGIFGTVCGIMTTFQALGQVQQATIAMVAPGISEALIATALGLFTAIPCVLAYNHFNRQANGLLHDYELFQEELLALINEQTMLTRG